MRVNKQILIPGVIGVVSFEVGVVVGYFLARRKVKATPEEQVKSTQRELDFKRAELDQEFNWKMQQLNLVIGKLTDALQKVDNVADQLNDQGEVYLGRFTRNGQIEVNKEEVMEILTDEDESSVDSTDVDVENDGWNYEVELANRTPDVPYVIHVDEFIEDELDHRQSTITFYRGDSILADEAGAPIYNPEEVVGKHLEFGKGSNDPTIVYIRNERYVADYEVLLNTGYFQVEVLGEEVEDVLTRQDLKHSVPKFRME